MEKMIEVRALDNGAHRNQTYHGTLYEGWAIVPKDMELPSSFPFVEIEVAEIDGVLTVTNMTEGVLPAPEEPTEREPSADEILDAMLGVTI